MARAPPPPPLPLLAALLAALAARAAAAAPLPVAVAVDWAAGPTRSGVTTAATVEVDIMPQLARSSGDPGFPGYFEALSNLNAAHVRFAPWYGYPRSCSYSSEAAGAQSQRYWKSLPFSTQVIFKLYALRFRNHTTS